jgi:hypothetical protein
MSLRSVIFMKGFFIIDPPQADLKYSIFNRQYSIPTIFNIKFSIFNSLVIRTITHQRGGFTHQAMLLIAV